MKRDVQLDAIRGFCLVLMMSGHVGSWVTKITLEFAGFTGGAEGFVFLSGFVAGAVYTKWSEKVSRRELWRRALAKTWTIYKFHIAVFLFVLAFALAFPTIAEPWREARYATGFFQEIPRNVGLGLLLLYQPTFMNILPLYCILIAITPLAIGEYNRGRARYWLAGSFLLWLATQFGFREWLLDVTLRPFFDPRLGSLSVLAWQIIYFVGLWLGFNRQKGRQLFRAYDPRWVLLCASGALFLFFARHFIRLIKRAERLGSQTLDTYAGYIPGPELIGWIETLTNKQYQAPLRLLNFVLVVYALCYVLERYKPLVNARWLIFLGRNSLQVWAFHAPIVYGLFLIEKNLLSSDATGQAILAVLSLLAIASMSIPAALNERYRAYQKLRRPALTTPTQSQPEETVKP
ncbi:MAG: OpgC domain-containing protein [Acidobacteriota bacterium]